MEKTIQSQTAIFESDLQQIADMLLLSGTLTECPGLVHGKMGIAVFFFHYARYTGNMLFADYAMDVIGEMLNQLNVNTPAYYEKGIAGIGAGIDYLIRNDLLDADDDICEDFDARMVRAVMYDPCLSFSQYDGYSGYGRYWMTRLRYQAPSQQARECLLCITKRIEENRLNIPEEEQTDVYCFLHDLQKVSGFKFYERLLNECREKWNLQSPDVIRSFPRFGDSTVGNIIRTYQRNRYFDDSLQNDIRTALKQIPDLDMEKVPTSTGLLTGYAGEGMLRLTALDLTNASWMELL